MHSFRKTLLNPLSLQETARPLLASADVALSIDYYNQHAGQFASDTLKVDMSPLYQQFLPLLPPGAHILDAGCGAGRDAAHFRQLGYRVSAFDASEKLVAIARQHSGLDVQQCRFLDYHSSEPLDGIWACASLLHVPDAGMAATLKHLGRQLRPGGVFYLSFKYGEQDSEHGGRQFTNSTEQRLRQHLQGSGLGIRQCWLTGDQRPGREDELWLNALLVREQQ